MQKEKEGAGKNGNTSLICKSRNKNQTRKWENEN